MSDCRLLMSLLSAACNLHYKQKNVACLNHTLSACLFAWGTEWGHN